VKGVPLENPPNPWHSTVVDYLGEPPSQRLDVYEDHTKSILAENDSPDLGFRWSVNPYRGCLHACAYCMAGDTLILTSDGRTKPLAALRVGDEIYGTELVGRYRRYVRTQVLDHWSVIKPAFRVTLTDGRELVASGDHRFLTARGWRHVIDDAAGRAHLTLDDRLLADAGSGQRSVGVDDALARELPALERLSWFRVKSIERLDGARQLFDITTGTGDFIANGVISHNCYARPSHQYLDLGAGSDFDRKIAVKPRAAELLREAFEKRSWQGELIMFSGNTDCYQPLEASYELTRACLEVCAEYRNPVHIITKAALIERDVDVISRLVNEARAGVSISIPFWDAVNCRAIEPHAPTPQRRIQAVRTLAAAGIPVTVNVAPLIPGLTDRDVPSILEAAAEAGARSASLIMLRLPGPVKEVFEERLRRALPLRAEKVLARTREIRGGKLNDPRFGERMTGKGEYFDAIRALFDTTATRLGLRPRTPTELDPQPATTFRRPTDRGGQLRLFD
jgi:DNA repair photolyase